MSIVEKTFLNTITAGIAQAAFRVVAAVTSRRRLRVAVVGDKTPVASCAEVLMGDPSLPVEINYFSDNKDFYDKPFSDFRSTEIDCVLTIAGSAAEEAQLLSRVGMNPGQRTPLVVSWNALFSGILQSLQRTTEMRSCLNFQKLFSIAAALEVAPRTGAVFECGVFMGGTTLFMSLFQQARGINRPIYGFDTFEGLPAPTQRDHDAGGHVYPAGFFAGSSVDGVVSLLKNHGCEGQATFHKGLVQDTLPGVLKTTPCSFALLDMDQYAGIYSALRLLLGSASKPEIIIIDDCSIPGVDQAIMDGCAGHPVTRTNLAFNFDIIVTK